MTAGLAWLVSLGVVWSVASRGRTLPSWAPLVARVSPSVVSLDVEAEVPRRGSGFALGPTEVITARHLVADAHTVTVRATDGTTATGVVRGTDARTDLALVAIADAHLPPARLGAGQGVTVGDWVLVVGNALGLGPTPVTGLLAQRGSRLEADDPGPRVEFWQLSLAANPGHSGGPVFDQRGRVVGVLSGAHAQGQAVAFAVPIEALHPVLERLRAGEHVSRAYLGLRAASAPEGLRVTSVVPSSPADLAGLRPGDGLVALDGTPLAHPEDLQRVLDRLSGGVHTTLVRQRDEASREVPVELTDWARQPVVVAGMTLGPVPGAGARVIALQPRSRAARADVRTGDVVRTIDGVPVQAPATIRDRLAGGAGAQLQVVRDGQLQLLQIGERARPARAPAPP